MRSIDHPVSSGACAMPRNASSQWQLCDCSWRDDAETMIRTVLSQEVD